MRGHSLCYLRGSLKKSNNGKKRKKQQAKMSTPVFSVHTEKSE